MEYGGSTPFSTTWVQVLVINRGHRSRQTSGWVLNWGGRERRRAAVLHRIRSWV